MTTLELLIERATRRRVLFEQISRAAAAAGDDLEVERLDAELEALGSPMDEDDDPWPTGV
jgi:hypothetical protein